MGADPTSSVVGFDHRVHGTDNLYVSDPSVFPTAPSVDPSLSIMAFSFVAADASRPRWGEAMDATACSEVWRGLEWLSAPRLSAPRERARGETARPE